METHSRTWSINETQMALKYGTLLFCHLFKKFMMYYNSNFHQRFHSYISAQQGDSWWLFYNIDYSSCKDNCIPWCISSAPLYWGIKRSREMGKITSSSQIELQSNLKWLFCLRFHITRRETDFLHGLKVIREGTTALN